MIKKLERYYNYYGINAPDKKFEVIQNPGAKSIKSLKDKIQRKIEIEGNLDYKLADIRDMARCSVLLNSYRDIPQFLLQLKQKYPSLNGYIARFPSGYKGIHLNFNIDGITVELQLSTQRSWEVKQLTEYCYVKWRNFNLKDREKTIREQEANLERLKENLKTFREEGKDVEKLQAEVERLDKYIIDLKIELKNDLKMQKQENDMTRELYEELHSDGELASVEDEIESIFSSFSANLNSENKNNNSELNDIINNTFTLDEDGKVDSEELDYFVNKTYKVASSIQSTLIKNIDDILKLQNKDVIIDDKILEGTKISRELMLLYSEILKEKLKDSVNLLEEYGSQILNERYNFSVCVTRFALENGLENNDCFTIINKYVQNNSNTIQMKFIDLSEFEKFQEFE